MLRTLIRYLHTIKYLKPIQVYGQVRTRVQKGIKIPECTSSPCIRPITNAWASSPKKQDRLHDANHLECLNMLENINSFKIWSAKNKSRLWLYHLHYFNYLHADEIVSNVLDLARSQLATNSALKGSLIKRWIEENPPTVQPAWEPYPISLRVVNWIKWLLAIKTSENVNEETIAKIHLSLTQQIFYLTRHLETHILANHYFANAKALIFAGLYFINDNWLHLGLKIFNEQLKEQILADGSHFELSPMYHALILEDILDIINLCNVYQHVVPKTWFSNARQMLLWLQEMCHPDGDFAFFNDTALNVAPCYAQLAEYAKILKVFGEAETIKNLEGRQVNNVCGYYRLVHNDMVLIADLAYIGATYQPGHAHADTLSFELSVARKRLIVNSGISTYANNSKRLAERSTFSHNTLIINDKNSSDVWKSFRVAKRAKVFDLSVACANKLQGSHDGYYSQYKIIHNRSWQFEKNQLTVCDKLFTLKTPNKKGRTLYNIKILFHIHPDIQVVAISKRSFALEWQRQRIASLTSELDAKLLASTYHPGFNITLNNQKIVVETDTTIPITIKTLIKSEISPCTFYS